MFKKKPSRPQPKPPAPVQPQVPVQTLRERLREEDRDRDLCYIDAANVGVDEEGRYWVLLDAPVYPGIRGSDDVWRIALGTFSHGSTIFPGPEELEGRTRTLSGEFERQRNDNHWNHPYPRFDGEKTEDWFRVWLPRK